MFYVTKSTYALPYTVCLNRLLHHRHAIVYSRSIVQLADGYSNN